MSAAWLVYALVTGTFIALAGFAIEGLCRQHRLPTRWVWAVGLFAIALLSVRAITARPEPPAQGVTVSLAKTPSVAIPADRTPTLLRALSDAVATGRTLIAQGLVSATRRLPAVIGEGAPVAWIVASTLAILVILGVHLRIAQVRRRWPVAELHGLDVRIAPAVGPAVLGVLRPFIVVPRWLLARSDDEQRLVLAHESEHVRARDHLLLAGACVIAALVPWHPAVWFMLARLRLAIELDCDARVLRRGVAPREYGTMLIELAGQCSGFTVGATALADEASHLQRRLLAMKPIRSRHVHLRAGALAATGLLAVLVACEAKLPTSAEVQSMDVAGAERNAVGTGLLAKTDMSNATFYVDGVRTTAEEAHRIASDHIISMSVGHMKDGAAPIISITTNGRRQLAMRDSTGTLAQWHMKVHSALMPADTGAVHAGMKSRTAFTGLTFIDGVRVDNAAMARLNPNDIAEVKILKAAAAAQVSSDPAAANGIIQVTTKKAAKR